MVFGDEIKSIDCHASIRVILSGIIIWMQAVEIHLEE